MSTTVKTLIDSEDRISIGDHNRLAARIEEISMSQDLFIDRAIRNFEIAKLYEYNKLDKVRNKFYERIIESLNG